jgi:hypothetical protein
MSHKDVQWARGKCPELWMERSQVTSLLAGHVHGHGRGLTGGPDPWRRWCQVTERHIHGKNGLRGYWNQEQWQRETGNLDFPLPRQWGSTGHELAGDWRWVARPAGSFKTQQGYWGRRQGPWPTWEARSVLISFPKVASENCGLFQMEGAATLWRKGFIKLFWRNACSPDSLCTLVCVSLSAGMY